MAGTIGGVGGSEAPISAPKGSLAPSPTPTPSYQAVPNYNQVFNPNINSTPSTYTTRQGCIDAATLNYKRAVAASPSQATLGSAAGQRFAADVDGCNQAYGVSLSINNPTTKPKPTSPIPTEPIPQPTDIYAIPTAIFGGIALVGGGAWAWYAIATQKPTWQIATSSIIAAIGVVAIVLGIKNANTPQGFVTHKIIVGGSPRIVTGSSVLGCGLSNATYTNTSGDQVGYMLDAKGNNAGSFLCSNMIW